MKFGERESGIYKKVVVWKQLRTFIFFFPQVKREVCIRYAVNLVRAQAQVRVNVSERARAPLSAY